MVTDYSTLPEIPLVGGLTLTLLGPGKNALQKLEKEWVKQLKEYGSDLDISKKLAEDDHYKSDPWLGSSDSATFEELLETKEKPDTSVPNGGSIAFIASFEGKACLFAGDATTNYLLEAIEPLLERSGKQKLKLDAWKLSHHGSKKSNLKKLMEKIDCKNILVSTNGAKYSHPDAECIAKIIINNGPDVHFYFNYETEHNQQWNDPNLKEQYNFVSHFPLDPSKPGITVSIE